jgi:hypothetical protein
VSVLPPEKPHVANATGDKRWYFLNGIKFVDMTTGETVLTLAEHHQVFIDLHRDVIEVKRTPMTSEAG